MIWGEATRYNVMPVETIDIHLWQRLLAALLIVIWAAMLPGTIGPPPPRYVDLNELDKQNEIYKSLMMKGN